MAAYDQALANLRTKAAELRDEHREFCKWDGRLYNGGIVVILACNVGATVFPPATTGAGMWLPKVLLAVATLGITLERAKNYGLRWKFHIERKNQFSAIVDRIDIFAVWPVTEQEEKFNKLVEEFAALRVGEGEIPGTEPIPSSN